MVCQLAVAYNASGLLLCWDSIFVRPQLKPNKIADDEVNNKWSKELRRPDIS